MIQAIARRMGLLIGLLLLAGIVQAQTPTPLPVFPITPGSSVEGNINNQSFSIRYSFEAQSGDSITLRMLPTSGDLDPYLILFDPHGEPLAENDDDPASEDRDSLIAVPIAETGTYIVEATRFQQASGPTSGTFRLTFASAGTASGGAGVDPLSMRPTFGVPFDEIEYQELRAGILQDDPFQQYFAVAGHQGDLIRVTMTTTSGDLIPQIAILNADLASISKEAQASPTEVIVYATLPERGWYLIEASRRSGSGTYDIYVDQRAIAVIELGQTVSETFTTQRESISYIFNAHIGDEIFVTVFATAPDSPLLPEIRLLDLSLNTIIEARAANQPNARVRLTIPRSAPYIIEVTNQAYETGPFNLRLSGIPVDTVKLSQEIATPVSYNNLYKGVISAADTLDYYRFSGKAGELVTLQMTTKDSDLDPYLILADSALNELAFNDNVGNTPNARIAQFALPADGDYFILATRAGLVNGATTGFYDLSLTVGQVALQSGVLTATLTWESEADFNLYIRDPDGRILSWSRPQISSGGILQIDSNTGCEIPSAQPVEHIYWPPGTPPPNGQYAIWVWYQDSCLHDVPDTFALTLKIDGETRLNVGKDTLMLDPNQRFEAEFLITPSGSFVTDPGQITTPNAQRRASEGGDTLIRYGQSLNGKLNDSVYARFYQFAASAGDQITIDAETLTGNLDPYVVLRSDTDANLASNDDATLATRNSRLSYTIPADGLYVIAVTRYGLRDGTTTGDFKLTLNQTVASQP